MLRSRCPPLDAQLSASDAAQAIRELAFENAGGPPVHAIDRARALWLLAHLLAATPEQHIWLALLLRDLQLGTDPARVIRVLAADHDDFIGFRDAKAHTFSPILVGHVAGLGTIRDRKVRLTRLCEQPIVKVPIVLEIEAHVDAH